MEGRHVFMGYLNMEDKTRETFDDHGRLRSGDVGKVDKDGFLYITGRIKGYTCVCQGIADRRVDSVFHPDFRMCELEGVGVDAVLYAL